MYIPTSKWVIEYQPIATQKLIQSLQNSKKHLLADKKGPYHLSQLVIYLYLLNGECLFLLKGVILNLVELDF